MLASKAIMGKIPTVSASFAGKKALGNKASTVIINSVKFSSRPSAAGNFGNGVKQHDIFVRPVITQAKLTRIIHLTIPQPEAHPPSATPIPVINSGGPNSSASAAAVTAEQPNASKTGGVVHILAKQNANSNKDQAKDQAEKAKVKAEAGRKRNARADFWAPVGLVGYFGAIAGACTYFTIQLNKTGNHAVTLQTGHLVGMMLRY